MLNQNNDTILNVQQQPTLTERVKAVAYWQFCFDINTYSSYFIIIILNLIILGLLFELQDLIDTFVNMCTTFASNFIFFILSLTNNYILYFNVDLEKLKGFVNNLLK